MKLLFYIALIVCCISVTLKLSQAQQDLTLEPEASGTDVTFAAIGRIQISQVFPTDNRLLRRVAYVESRDGVDINTYRYMY